MTGVQTCALPILTDPWDAVIPGSTVSIINCTTPGYNNSYTVLTKSEDGKTFTMEAPGNLGSTSVTGFELAKCNIYSPGNEDPAEIVLLWLFNNKPDSMLFNDARAYPWIQDYALALAKDMLGQAREKFAQIAGPQGGTQLNGAALKTEAKAELEALENELKTFVDGSQPYTWIVG